MAPAYQDREIHEMLRNWEFATHTFKSRGLDLRPELSLFNMLNANPVLVQINTFGPSLGNVTTILNPRVLRVGLSMKF
jgi:hypothetical protein